MTAWLWVNFSGLMIKPEAEEASASNKADLIAIRAIVYRPLCTNWFICLYKFPFRVIGAFPYMYILY